MQQSLDPTVAGLIIALLIAILVIVIVVIKYLLRIRKPYSFTDDITDISKIFQITPTTKSISHIAEQDESPEQQQPSTSSAFTEAPPDYPQKNEKQEG